MREYGKIYTQFWTSQDIQSLSEDGRLLAAYLLTCPHGNMLGCFILPLGYVSEDLKWSSERVSKGFDELFRNGYAYHDRTSKFVFICAYLKWNQFENPNVGKAAAKLFEALGAPHSMKAMLVAALREFSGNFPAPILDKFETLSIPFDNPFELSSKTRAKPEPEPQPEPKPKSSSASPLDENFEIAWKEYPSRPGRSKADALKAWNARIKGGSTPDEMIAGVKRYAAYCIVCISDTQYIKQPETFFGPGLHFKSDWAIPIKTQKVEVKTSRHSGFDALDYHDGVSEDGRIN